MAIDYGKKRVGIASTDDGGTFALPRIVLENDEGLLDKITSFIKENDIERVVMGESKNFKGELNSIQKDIDKLKGSLEEKGVEVVLHSEILTTMEARQIQGNSPLTDASAAALILKSYIDNKQ